MLHLVSISALTCVPLVNTLDCTEVDHLPIQAEEQACVPQLHETVPDRNKSSGRLLDASSRQRREQTSAIDLDTINELREMNEARYSFNNCQYTSLCFSEHVCPKACRCSSIPVVFVQYLLQPTRPTGS